MAMPPVSTGYLTEAERRVCSVPVSYTHLDVYKRQAGESIHLALHNTEECLCGLRRKILFLTKQTDPGLEDGQRGTKFVGSILGEAALHQKSPAQPLRQVIKGMCQLCYLIPSIRDGQGLSLIHI